ncbi:MAG: hypothetical protein NTV86_16305 [Planctomycetota bacterium]|nr:hypothetical protein [Planctomycetota bacterium]
MKDTQTVTIVLLAVTAIVLGALLITAMPETAQAATSARQGSYLIASVRASSSRELVYVINVPLQGVIVYGLDVNKNEIAKVAEMDLRKVFGTK